MKNKKDISEKLEQENKFEEQEAEREAIEEIEQKTQAAILEDAEQVEAVDIASKEDEYLEGWKRCQADFENYKKRQTESQKDLLRYATQNIILQILPVIDNFQASTSHIPEDHKENPWVTGIMYIQKQLEQVLADNGVVEIEVKIGDHFDPMKHEAIEDKDCKLEKGEKKEFKNKIKKIITRGYQMGERVARPARVIVE